MVIAKAHDVDTRRPKVCNMFGIGLQDELFLGLHVRRRLVRRLFANVRQRNLLVRIEDRLFRNLDIFKYWPRRRHSIEHDVSRRIEVPRLGLNLGESQKQEHRG